MAQRRNTLMDPPIEDLLDKVDSKFTLVALSAKRARQINSYYNQLGEGLGVVVPPQVTSVSGKPLTIAFEEISAGKATFHRPEPGEEDEAEAALAEVGSDPLVAAVDILAVTDSAVTDSDVIDSAVEAVAVGDSDAVALEVDLDAGEPSESGSGDDAAEPPADQ
jgi:DNA-directed RNA polymerase subunit omega